jgi:hypothetical protein
MPPGGDDQQLSSQDRQDLTEIATKLPTGHPMQAKVAKLLSATPTDYEKSINTGKEGGLGAVWNDISGAAGSLIPSKSNLYGLASIGGPLAPMKAAAHTISNYMKEKDEGRSPAYRAVAGLGSMTGLADPTPFENAARHGDPEGVIGHAVLPTIGAVSPLLGEGASALRGGVGSAIHTPEGGLHPGVDAMVHPTKLPGFLIDKLFPEGPESVNAREGERTAGELESRMSEVEKARQKELANSERLREQEARSRNTRKEPEVLPAISTDLNLRPMREATPSGSEGTAARWTNERVRELAAQGNRTAIEQMTLRGMQLPPNARYVMGDANYPRAVLNPRETTAFSPEGTPIRDMASPEKPSNARIVNPTGEPVQSSSAIQMARERLARKLAQSKQSQ